MRVPSASPAPPFSVSTVRDPGDVVVRLAGELDLATADVLEREVRKLRLAGVDSIVIDLSELHFVDSTGLRMLITLRNSAKREGQGLAVVPGPERVQRIFELTATRGLFDWREAPQSGESTYS